MPKNVGKYKFKFRCSLSEHIMNDYSSSPQEDNLELWAETCLSSRIAQKWGKFTNKSLFYRHSPPSSQESCKKETQTDREQNSQLDWQTILQATKSLSIEDIQSKSKDANKTKNNAINPQHMEQVWNSPPTFMTPYCVDGLQSTEEEVVVLRKFKRNRENLLKQLFSFYNERVSLEIQRISVLSCLGVFQSIQGNTSSYLLVQITQYDSW